MNEWKESAPYTEPTKVMYNGIERVILSNTAKSRDEAEEDECIDKIIDATSRHFQVPKNMLLGKLVK